eukprot:jgi/Mesen1/10423/ME000082S09935
MFQKNIARVVNKGYAGGYAAPGRCSDASMCQAGDSSVEAYLAAHNVLRSHAAAVTLYRSKFQGGKIGITLNCIYHYPGTNSPDDAAAANRVMEFFDPIYFGDYPESMRRQVGERLPRFTDDEAKALKGSFDFLGLNFYTAKYAFAAGPPAGAASQGPTGDSWARVSTVAGDGTVVGEPTVSSWLFVAPAAVKEMLMWLTARYNSVPILITENGVGGKVQGVGKMR